MPFRIPDTIRARLNGESYDIEPFNRTFLSASRWPLRGWNGTQAVPCGVDELHTVKRAAKLHFAE